MKRVHGVGQYKAVVAERDKLFGDKFPFSCGDELVAAARDDQDRRMDLFIFLQVDPEVRHKSIGALVAVFTGLVEIDTCWVHKKLLISKIY